MEQKKIILGVGGGIAAYKACEIASALRKEHYAVVTVMTAAACQFITPLSLKSLTHEPVYADQFEYCSMEPLHIELCRTASAILIAPTTANIIGKLANGICDDLLSTIVCAFDGAVILAPAMNTQMWNNPIVQRNLHSLQQLPNYAILQPVHGELACGTVGIGKLTSVENILDKVKHTLEYKITPAGSSTSPTGSLEGFKVLITAGGTREPIDPVRFIGNRSSGKMGLAMADAAYAKGAQVVLITTNPQHRAYTVIKVETAQEMQSAVEDNFDDSQIVVMAAAVSDFKPIAFSPAKIKKVAESDWHLTFTKNPDIIGTLGRLKREHQVLVGFAAESHDLIENARHKLQEKKLDMIIANQIDDPDIGFYSDDNEVCILKRNSDDVLQLPRASKSKIAEQLWIEIEKLILN